MELAKPGTAEFDVGQISAEMYCLQSFRDQKLGGTLLRSFLNSYKVFRQRSINAGKTAIRIGAHLVVIMPGAWSSEGSPEQIRRAVRYGIDLIGMGYMVDAPRLSDSIVGSLVTS